MIAIEPLMHLIESHGATIMLSLLAARWIWSIYTMVEQASTAGRSVMFDAICICAYIAGLVHFRAAVGPGWAAEPTAAFFFVNLTLIGIDLSLLMWIKRIERSQPF